MHQLKENIAQKVKETVESSGFLHIETVVRGNPNTPVFEIYVDNETGINSEDCMRLSRKISEYLDSNEKVPTKYRLDVSSPGVDRPLKYLEQYKKHLNREFEIKYRSGEKELSFRGKLLEVEGDTLKFGGKNENFFKFADIKSAKVLISF
jgi:ribosome maturation factor RimP